jgi:hypothetical protein
MKMTARTKASGQFISRRMDATFWDASRRSDKRGFLPGKEERTEEADETRPYLRRLNPDRQTLLEIFPNFHSFQK